MTQMPLDVEMEQVGVGQYRSEPITVTEAGRVTVRAHLPGAAERDEAIARVEEAASKVWLAAALDAVRSIAQAHPEFTTDDVWEVLESRHVDCSTTEPRAMGAVMKQARRNGWVEVTDRLRRSSREICHRRPQQVWASKILWDGS